MGRYFIRTYAKERYMWGMIGCATRGCWPTTTISSREGHLIAITNF